MVGEGVNLLGILAGVGSFGVLARKPVTAHSDTGTFLLWYTVKHDIAPRNSDRYSS